MKYMWLVIESPDNTDSKVSLFENKKNAIDFAKDLHIDYYENSLEFGDYSNEKPKNSNITRNCKSSWISGYDSVEIRKVAVNEEGCYAD